MEIVRNRLKRQIFIHQNEYIKHVGKRFGMSECDPCNSPAVSALLLRSEDVSKNEKSYPYRELIGSLTFISIV